MPKLTFSAPMPFSAEALYAWHANPGAFARLAPPWERLKLLDATPLWCEGSRWTFRGRFIGPWNRNWTVEHHGIIEGRQFCYRQVKGPFQRWDHCLQFRPNGETSILENRIDYELPAGCRLLKSNIERRIARMFTWRHAIIHEDLKRHVQYQDRPRLTVAITGSRGLIGTELVSFLASGGHTVIRLVTGDAKPPFDDGTAWKAWKPQEPLPAGTLSGVDVVVNLAGDNIASGRWTAAKKARIRESRAMPTRHLAAAIERDGVKTFLSGSAIGIYGDRGEELLTEDSPPGAGFLAGICREWEETAKCDARVVNLRTSVVLSAKGGALAMQLPAFRFGQGAVLGTGKQYTPWIDINDIVYAIHHLLFSQVHGPVNLCSPQPVTNRVFGRVLAKVLKRPYLLTVPPFALRLLFGPMADDALLASTRALPEKLLADGFKFMHDDLGKCLRMQLGKTR